MEMRFGVLVVPVSDVGKAKDFNQAVGFHLDVDHVSSEDFRVVHAGTKGRLDGPMPGHRSKGSFAGFSDRDGNGWFLQEVNSPLPGHDATSPA